MKLYDLMMSVQQSDPFDIAAGGIRERHPSCRHHQPGAIAHHQLLHQKAHIILDGLLAKMQLLGRLSIGAAFDSSTTICSPRALSLLTTCGDGIAFTPMIVVHGQRPNRVTLHGGRSNVSDSPSERH